ncbi:hypothetical protein TNCV_2600751 [Trichonephila clavipes]|nr:hypothetical protein TNCV_2600751 [Trichonephila clavipes]
MDRLKFKLEIVEALAASKPTNKSILTDEDNSAKIFLPNHIEQGFSTTDPQTGNNPPKIPTCPGQKNYLPVLKIERPLSTPGVGNTSIAIDRWATETFWGDRLKILAFVIVNGNIQDWRCIFQRTIDKYSACVEVGKPIDENSACVEVGTTHKHLRRGVNLNNFKNYFSSNDITCEEVKSVESTFLLDTSYVRATREPEKKKGRIFLNFSKMYKNALKEDLIRVVEELDGIVESTDTIVKLKTKIENSSTFENDPDFVKTLNKETATHIGIREAEDWFRPIDLAKECDIYISSRSGSHKEIPITYGYTQDPFKNKSQNFKTKIKENYPQYLERENKNCYICGDSSHCARDCEKRFKPKESNDHIHNRINVNTLKVESEKQNSDECANLQYVNVFVENQPVTALIDSGCQIPVLNSSLIRVQTPSEEIITLSSCFGEQRMVEVKPINISLNQHSPSLSVRTAISPTLTEEFIIHPSVL